MASFQLLEQRAVLLATVALTRHPDVLVNRNPTDRGPDLEVEIAPGGKSLGRMFGVELKAVISQQRIGRTVDSDRVRLASPLRSGIKQFQARYRDLPYPLLFIVFTMDSDRGYFGWLREPQVRDGSPTLANSVVEYASEWHDHTHESVVAAITDWYDARRSSPLEGSARRKAG